MPSRLRDFPSTANSGPLKLSMQKRKPHILDRATRKQSKLAQMRRQ